MIQKTFTLFTTLILVSGSLYAIDQKTPCDKSDINGDRMKPPMYFDRDRGLSILHHFRMLDLSSDQQKALREIQKESESDILHPGDAFTTESFDKTKYLEIVKNSKVARIENEAARIEKAYAILTHEQKKQLKTILDMQQILEAKKMKFKGMPDDKDRNGRR